jgi:hypothetical protein
MSIFQQAKDLLKNLQTRATNPITQGIMDLPASIALTAQRIPQAVNTLVMNPQEAGNLVRTAPQYSNFKVPGFQTAANFAANTAQPFGQGLQNMAMGVNKIQTSPGLLNKTAGGFQMLKGASQTLTPFTAWGQVPNVISSLPAGNKYLDVARNVSGGIVRGIGYDPTLAPSAKAPDMFKVKMPEIIGGQEVGINPIEMAGGMIGFVKAPFNSYFFKFTEKMFPAGNLIAKGTNLKKWVAVTGLRGSIEDVILSFDQMPENATTAQKIWFMTQNAGIGAVTEIGGRGMMDIGTTGVNKVVNNKLAVNAYDELSRIVRKLNTLVKTMEFDLKTGKRKEIPMWKYELERKGINQKGGINFSAKVGGKPAIENPLLPKTTQGLSDTTSSVQPAMEASYTEVDNWIKYARDNNIKLRVSDIAKKSGLEPEVVNQRIIQNIKTYTPLPLKPKYETLPRLSDIPENIKPLVNEMKKYKSWEDFKLAIDDNHTPDMGFGSVKLNGKEIPIEQQFALSDWVKSKGFKTNEEAFNAIKNITKTTPGLSNIEHARGTKAAVDLGGFNVVGAKNLKQANKVLQKAGEIPSEIKVEKITKDFIKDYYQTKKTPVVGDVFINSKGERVEITRITDQGVEYFLQGKKKGIGGTVYLDSPRVAQPKPLSETIQQAKASGQSFDEWMKGQTSKAFHGSDVANIIEKEGFKKMPIKTGVSAFGEGSYFTSSKANAKGYGGVVDAYLPKDIKLKKVFDSDAYKVDTQKLIKEGYDGTIMETGNGQNIAIFDPSKIKTRSQLKAEWDKANTGVKKLTAQQAKAKGELKPAKVPATKPLQEVSQQELTLPTTPSGTGGKSGSYKGIIPQENPKDPFYNIKRINSTPEGKKILFQTVEEVKPQIEKVVGKTLSHDEILKRLQYVADDLIKNIGRQKTAELGAAQLRLRQNIAKMADEGKVTKELLESLLADKSFAANEARLLGQRNINADPLTDQGKLKTEYIKNILKINDDLDDILKKAEDVNWEDPKSTTAFYRTYVKPMAEDWIDKLRYNAMLSSPNTHIVNIAGNWQGTGVLTPIQKTLEGPIDLIHSMITGKKRTRFTGEGIEYAKGYYTAGNRAWKNLVNVMSGKSNVANIDTRNIPLATGKVSGTIEKSLDVFTRGLEGMDIFFRTLTQSGLEKSYKFRLAKGGRDLSKQSMDEANKLLFRGEMVQKGEGAISNFLGGGANWIMNARNSNVAPFRWLAKLTFPFVATGTNLAKTGFEANPLTGALNLIGNSDKTAAAAKMIMGGVVTLVGANLALSDRLTAYSSASLTEREEAKGAGRQPWAIKLGDKWVSYSKIHPLIAFQLAMTASVVQALKDQKIEENQAEAIMNGLSKSLIFFADQTYFKNLGDFSNFVRGDEFSLKRLASNYPSQFIPFKSALGYVNRILDQYQRKPDTDANWIVQVLQQIGMSIPGASQFTPLKLDESGQPTKNTNVLENAISPVRMTNINPQGEQNYQTGREITKIKQESAYTSKQNTKQAEQIYRELKVLPKDEANARARQLKQANPLLFNELKDIVNAEKQGLEGMDKRIISLPVTDGSRARYILSELNKLSTAEEKNAKVKEWRRKKIITPEVFRQLKILISQ